MTDDITLLETPRFRVVRRHYEVRGQKVSREVIEHPGAVVVLPLLDDCRVCLIENYRPAVGEKLLELPAGTCEPGEPVLETARRELLEETGFRAKRFEAIPPFLMSPGILHERMHGFVATGLAAGEPWREAGEDIENRLVTWDEALSLVENGRIHDAKTITMLLWWERFGRGRNQAEPPTPV